MQQLELIPPLSNFNFNAIPAGLIIVMLDDAMTIVEANDAYYRIIGYSKEEVRDLFNNQAIKTIHKDDVSLAFQKVKKLIIGESDEYSIRLRLVNKVDKYRSIHLTAHTEMKDGHLYLHLLLLDLSKHYNLFQQIKDEHDFNAILNTLTDDSYFDYNIKEKSIRFSPSFNEKYSLPTVIKNFPDYLIDNGFIKENFIKLDEAHLDEENEETLYANTTTFNFNNEAFHYDISYKLEQDIDGKNIRVIGKMNDVTKQFEQIENLTFIAQTDQLTGLYNKKTTEIFIANILQNQRMADSVYALFIIDADNFKSVNDTFGHLYGDIVLTQLADHLKSLFRSNDIIGRIGGDEFIVFLRDTSNIDLVHKKADEICAAFKKTYTENSISVEMTASVGISLFPVHGTTFNELYKNADIALYKVKTSGKARYEIYDGVQQELTVNKRTKLDESVIKKDFKDNQIEYIFRLLYSYKDSHTALQAVLPLVMNMYNFTRCFFYESYSSSEVINSFTVSTNNTHEAMLKYEFNKANFVKQVEHLKTYGYYFRDSSTVFNEEDKHVLFKDSSALLCYPVISGDDVIGVIGFDSAEAYQVFSEEKLENLLTISSIIATFLSKDLALKKAKVNEDMVMSVLDELDQLSLDEIKTRLQEFLKLKSGTF